MVLERQIFDDGSTLTWNTDTGFTYATQSTDPLVNQQSANWAPQGVNPAAGSWSDVLKFGLSRVIDAKTRPLAVSNTMPVQTTGAFATNAAMPGYLGVNMGAIIIGLVIVGAFLMLKK